MSIPRRYVTSVLFVAVSGAIAAAYEPPAPAPSKPDPTAEFSRKAAAAPRPTVDEARGRAELLQETLHAVLHVVHHEYYREDEGLAIPAQTLKKVFGELATRQQVGVRWLAVDGAAMNADHLPQTEFERQAVAAIGSGKDSLEQVDADVYRRAGAITLTSECLKCHLPNRKSTADRSAGLIISIPIDAR